MVVNGWTLLFHEAIIGQVNNLADAYERARKADPRNFRSNANVKLLAAVAKLMLEVIPADPSRSEYRQGNTLGDEYRHWFRAKFFGRFRLFFRYDSRARIIVYAWATMNAPCVSAAAGTTPTKRSGACLRPAIRRTIGRR